MVVEQPRDLIAIEQTGMYDGLYHVLLGRISPLDGVGPDELTIDALLRRVDEPSANAGGERVVEVILALNPTLEGDGTALYLAGELERREGLRLTRLARGLPSGRDIELASKAVLADAIAGRRGV
jgi:recombination protein RecR